MTTQIEILRTQLTALQAMVKSVEIQIEAMIAVTGVSSTATAVDAPEQPVSTEPRVFGGFIRKEDVGK